MYEDIKVWRLSLIGLMSVAGIVTLVLLLQVVYYQTAAQAEQKDLSQPPEELSNLLAAEQAKLLEYRIIDPKKKLVAIPIDRAKQLVLRELAESEASPKE
jgi:hypothetical protein